MRIKTITDSQGVLRKALLSVAGKLMMGGKMPDIMHLLSYRPALFGEPFSAYVQQVLRADGPWTVAERELFGAFVSDRNQCQFCFRSHAAMVATAMPDGEALVEAVVTSWRTAPISEPQRAAICFLEKLTLYPSMVKPADMEALRQQALSDEAIESLIHICAIFSLINRVANALQFEVPSPNGLSKQARVLLRFGYQSKLG